MFYNQNETWKVVFFLEHISDCGFINWSSLIEAEGSSGHHSKRLWVMIACLISDVLSFSVESSFRLLWLLQP